MIGGMVCCRHHRVSIRIYKDREKVDKFYSIRMVTILQDNLLDMNINKFAVYVVGAVLFVGAWAYTQAVGDEITACVKKDGSVHIIGDGFKREDCKKKETLLSWNMKGEKGDKGDIGEKGEKGDKGDDGDNGENGTNGTELHLFDANGQDLGVLVNIRENNEDFFTTYNQNLTAFLQFQNFQANPKTKFQYVENIDYFFEEENCEGEPFTRLLGSLYAVRKGNPYQNYWMFDLTETPKSRSYLSQAVPDARLCVPNVGTIEYSVMLKEISLPFTEPLAWPLEVKPL